VRKKKRKNCYFDPLLLIVHARLMPVMPLRQGILHFGGIGLRILILFV
jgi:hypothetical protein